MVNLPIQRMNSCIFSNGDHIISLFLSLSLYLPLPLPSPSPSLPPSLPPPRTGYDPYDAFNQRKGLHSIPRQGQDCHGHGTHVASLCGGKTFGAAKKVTIYSVRVLSCENSAPWSVVLDGLDFVSQIIPRRMKPAIVTMSLSGLYHESVNEAIKELHQKNIPVITVAGNGETDCCSRSPASSPHTITVAGTRIGDGLYRIGKGTNFGRCVDIFAPGELILGANYLCKNCSKLLSGTSMAAPIVAGIAAIHMSRKPLMTPAQIKERLINDSLKGVVDFRGMPENYHSLTPNRLVHLPGMYHVCLRSISSLCIPALSLFSGVPLLHRGS